MYQFIVNLFCFVCVSLDFQTLRCSTMLRMMHGAALTGRQHVNGKDTPISTISIEIVYLRRIDDKYHRRP